MIYLVTQNEILIQKIFDLLMSTPFKRHMPFNFKFNEGYRNNTRLRRFKFNVHVVFAILPISELNKTPCHLVVLQLKLDPVYKENDTYKCKSIKVSYSVLIYVLKCTTFLP